VVNSEDVDGVVDDLVDDPVVPVQELSKRRIRELWNTASHFWELHEHLDRTDHAGSELARIALGIASDERADRGEILSSLRSPDQASHLARRSRTSS
jgi:hypothetical protein